MSEHTEDTLPLPGAPMDDMPRKRKSKGANGAAAAAPETRRDSIAGDDLLERIANQATQKIQRLGPALLEGIVAADGTEGATLTITVKFLAGGEKSKKRFEVKGQLTVGTESTKTEADLVNGQLVLFS